MALSPISTATKSVSAARSRHDAAPYGGKPCDRDSLPSSSATPMPITDSVAPTNFAVMPSMLKNADMAKRQSGPQFIPSLGQDDNQI